ncbi:MAG: hypothetical protein V1707_02630 [bacterium]
MKLFLRKLFGRQTPRNDFSYFFHHASAKEKEELFREVIKEANEDQRAMMEQYDKMSKTV